jgi:hypothetical protein
VIAAFLSRAYPWLARGDTGMTKLSAALLLFFIATTPVHGQSNRFESGHSLKDLCDAEGGFSAGKCIGYVTAIADMYRYISSPGATICIPPETTADELVSTVRNHLSENPGDLHLPAFPVVATAFVTGFPCR